jgi:peroxiredoxin
MTSNLFAADEMLKMGVDDVYCISVNDAFVMRQWGIVQGLVEDKNIDNPDPKCPLNPGNFTTIKLIPDGAAKFTKAMGMNCKSSSANF